MDGTSKKNREVKPNSMSIFKSITKNLCPRCNQGRVFEYSNAFHPKKFDKMHVNCKSCGLKYEKEVGFFYGAMYVSYGLTAGWVIVSYLLNEIFFNIGIWYFMGLVALPIFIFAPVTFRVSRLIWLNIFFSKKGKLEE